MTSLAYAILGAIAELTLNGGGYAASWHIVERVPEAQGLDVVCDNDHPANAALQSLIAAGLVVELVELPYRYTLKSR
jgi:hypothetical protein